MLRIPALLSLPFLALTLACGPSEETLGPNEVCFAGATEACYSGSTGTEGVGTCQGGIRTCLDDQTAWGPCEGEVVSGQDLCQSGADEDCDGTVDEDTDLDGDGFTACSGDCCETTAQCNEPANVNPGAVEVIGEGGEASADENCNGAIDEVAVVCDTSLLVDEADPVSAARAIDVCNDAVDGAYGLISAQYTRADGSVFAANAQHGLHEGYGPNVLPRLGAGMLALSTGAARLPDQVDACGGATCSFNAGGTAPVGFPQDVPNCSGGQNINDDIALSMTLRAPVNATGYSFDFMFYSFEYPEYVCSTFNDQFVALVQPAPEGAINGNIAFDAQTNPVSVNIAFFDVCDGCPEGTAFMEGTGFNDWNDAGATSWLRTQAPVEAGSEFTIRFVIWDTGDSALDSTVLIDNFQWLADPVGVGTNPID